MTTVVVGGGTSGLAAAVVLEQAGEPVMVLEKRPFAGGRIACLERDGFRLDLGAQFMFTRYPATFEMAKRLGVSGELAAFDPWLAVFRDGVRYELNTDPVRDLKEIKSTFAARRLLSPVSRVKAAKFIARLASLRFRLDFDDPGKAMDLDAVSFADFVREGYGEELLEYVAQPIASTLSLGMPEEISAAHGLALSWYMLRGLRMFRKGIGFLAEEMSKRCRDVRLGAEVRRVVVEDCRVRGVELASGDGEDFIEADRVVCTAPANHAARMLSDLPPAVTGALEKVRYSQCMHVMLAVEGRPFGKAFALALPRREAFGFPGLTENSLKAECAPEGCGLVHVYTHAGFAGELLGLPARELQLAVIRELKRIEPSFPEEPLFCETYHWPEALCLAGPGHFSNVLHLGDMIGSVEGLELAGEYFGTPSMEAAISSGMRAAERTLRRGPRP